jgi:hypothetical protein
MFLYLYFGVLVLALAVVSGVLSWPWALVLAAVFIFVERRFVQASHITDGDHASDEHGQFRETPPKRTNL